MHGAEEPGPVGAFKGRYLGNDELDEFLALEKAVPEVMAMAGRDPQPHRTAQLPADETSGQTDGGIRRGGEAGNERMFSYHRSLHTAADKHVTV